MWLQMLVVWEPMLSGDSRSTAERQAERGTDPRMVYHAWDGENRTGHGLGGTMGIGAPAWDV